VEQELRLSDAYLKIPGRNSAELVVTVININSVKSHTILNKCRILKEYSLFIDMVRKYEKKENGTKKAIEEYIQNGILAEYLKRKGSEVRNMLIAEYDYETDIRIKQEEAKPEGIQEGIQAGMQEERKQMIINALETTKNVKQTTLILRLDEQEVRKIAEEKGLFAND